MDAHALDNGDENDHNNDKAPVLGLAPSPLPPPPVPPLMTIWHPIRRQPASIPRLP